MIQTVRPYISKYTSNLQKALEDNLTFDASTFMEDQSFNGTELQHVVFSLYSLMDQYRVELQELSQKNQDYMNMLEKELWFVEISKCYIKKAFAGETLEGLHMNHSFHELYQQGYTYRNALVFIREYLTSDLSEGFTLRFYTEEPTLKEEFVQTEFLVPFQEIEDKITRLFNLDMGDISLDIF